jgi:hypothetical protein
MLTEKEIYAERSQLDSKHNNDAARATAQASILINGGAATAVLAVIAKEGVLASLAIPAAYALGGYALGVVFGTLMLFGRTQSSSWWMRWGQERALEREEVVARRSYRRAVLWKRFEISCFALAILSFLGASAEMVMALLGK